MAAQPKCPSCEVEGKQYVANTPSDQKAPGGMAKYEIIHCGRCGHIYNVLANYTINA